MIRHILADGRHLDSIDGYIVPAESAGTAYRILAGVLQKGGNYEDNEPDRSYQAAPEPPAAV